MKGREEKWRGKYKLGNGEEQCNTCFGNEQRVERKVLRNGQQ